MDNMASQGDGKKRRSFLPAPKRASESQFAAPQASTIPRMIQSQLPIMQPAAPVYARETSQIPSFAPKPPPSVGFREQTRAPPGESRFMERQKEESSFGAGLHVGARVKIGGVKPGILRYLGPTHLAPGIFCGIELLDPDGNHNGEVNGHRYFFCLPNHGIFAPKEKVCLDTSNDIGSLVSDSDMYYSSAGNLTDKRHRTRKGYGEGELNSRAFHKSNNVANTYGTQYIEDSTQSRRHRDIEGIGRSNLPYNTQPGRSEPLQSHGFSESPSYRLQHPGFPPAGKPSTMTPPSQPALPNYSRAYIKYHDEFYPRRSPAYSSQSDSSSSFEALTDIHDSISDFETHQEHGRTAPVYSNYGAKPDRSYDNSMTHGALSTGARHQLDTSNRQYLNFTFDRDGLNRSGEFEERESDSSFYDEEFDTKDGSQNYPKYAEVGNVLSGDTFRGVSSALDKANKQQYHDHMVKVGAKSNVPTEGVAYPRSGTLDTSMSDNYAIFRAGLDPAMSVLKCGEGHASNIDFSLDEKGGSGLFTGLHTCNDERISEGGYVFKSSSGDNIGGGSQMFSVDTQNSSAKGICLQRGKVGGVVKEGEVSSCIIKPRTGVSGEYRRDNIEPRIGLSGENRRDSIEPRIGLSGENRRGKVEPRICVSGENMRDKVEPRIGASEENRRDKVESRIGLSGENRRDKAEPRICVSGENRRDKVEPRICLSEETKKNKEPRIGLTEKRNGLIIEPTAGLSGGTKGNNIDSKIDLPGETKGDNIESNVNGPSPDMAQTLEWDYGQDFEGNQSISTSTGTSESLNDRLKDLSDDSSSVYEGDMASGLTDDSDHEFENIDELSFFRRNTGQTAAKPRKLMNSFELCSAKYSSVVTCNDQTDEHFKQGNMTPSVTITSISSDSSQGTVIADYVTHTPGSIEDGNFFSGDLKHARNKDSFPESQSTSPGSFTCVEESTTSPKKTRACQDGGENHKQNISAHKDTSNFNDSSVVAKPAASYNKRADKKTLAAHNEINIQGCDIPGTVVNRKERPLSLLSTSSTDTGYVPDTDSELGTLVSHTPDTDWVDTCGVSHPTTHAPLDGDAPTAAEKKDENSLVKSAASLSGKTAVKTRDDDDYCSDLTVNTEDERVEADQLEGQGSKVARSALEPVTIDISDNEDQENDPDLHQKDESVTPEISPVSPKIEDFQGKDGKSSHTEDTTPEGKGKPRKPVVITKKRSDNVDHKMPNINVTSRLADYIKAPVPVKSKEEKEKEKELKKNKIAKNASQNSSKYKHDASRASSEEGDYKAEEKFVKEKPKPIIKRERPKSKWENIMCQIESSKDTVKVKPISEIKSSLAEYLHTPLPQLPSDDTEIMPAHPRKEFKSKLKPLPPPPPKIDFSKVKSKLNVPTAASAIKAVPKREKPLKAGNLKNDNKVSRGSSTNLNAESAISDTSADNIKMSESSLALGTSQTELSALENKDENAQSQGKEGILSRSSTADIKKDSRRSSIHSVKLEISDKSKSSAEQVSKSGESVKKVTQATTHQSKKAIIPASKVTKNAVSNNIRSIRTTSKSLTKKDFEQLESLCEARAEEVVQLKMHLDAAIQAFDAMAVLANYSSNELNAFECPALSQKLEVVQRQLEDYAQQIAELNSQKAALDKDLNQMLQEKEEAAKQTKAAQDIAEKEREEHEKLTHDLSDTHMAVLSTQRDELTAKHEETVNKLTQFYETQFELQRQAHERQVSDIMNECKLEINSLKISNLEEVQELRNKHDDQMEELHKQHRNKMEDISLRFEAIKFSLSEKVDYLRKECDDLAIRARNSEEALQKDADCKVRIALAPYINLPREIESLKSIQGMRLEEIQKLRTKIMDLEKQLEEVPIGREKIISLQQKIENLEAIISIKTEHEKQLHQRCQVLMRKYDRESRANKRISMDFEQIMWRMSQSADFDSCEDSLTKQQLSQSYHSGDRAPDSVRHSASPSRDTVRHVRRHTSKSSSEGDRKLRSKSANSVSGKNDDQTTTAGPHSKRHKHSSRSQIAENDQYNRMWQSAGPEVMFELLSDHSDSGPQMQLNEHEEQTVTGPQVTSVYDMTNSYARSLSGVTDSGVYDSLTRSDVFNSSTASTDLELGASVNLSVTCDSTGDDDRESGPAAGNYNLA